MSSSLHPIEQRVLSALAGRGRLDFESLVKDSELKPDQVRRAIEWLSTKKLIAVSETVKRRLEVMGKTPPELALVTRASQGPVLKTPDQLRVDFGPEEYSAGFGRAKAAGWITIDQTVSPPIVRVVDAEGPKRLQLLMERISRQGDESLLSEDEAKMAADLLRRGFLKRSEERQVSVEITQAGSESRLDTAGTDFVDRLTPEILAAGAWRGKSLRSIDVEAKAPRFYPGRRHPVRDFIKEVRETYISMGFTELQGVASSQLSGTSTPSSSHRTTPAARCRIPSTSPGWRT